MNNNDKFISVNELKDMIFSIRDEYDKENGFDNGVDYIINEISDGIDNMVFLNH